MLAGARRIDARDADVLAAARAERAKDDQGVTELNLDYIMDNPWVVVPISALRETNVNSVVEWLIRQAK